MFSPNALHFTKERSDMISFYENFHNINKMSAIFVSSALRRVELFFPPVPLFPMRLELRGIFM